MSVMRGIISLFIILILIGCLAASGCIGEKEPEPEDRNKVIRGATFYVDDLNDEKMSNADTVKILADIVRSFEIIAIEGIDDPDGSAMKILMDEINSGTDENGQAYNYQYNLSEPVGNSGSEEQYAYIYNRNLLYPSSIPRIYYDSNFTNDPYLVAFRAYEGQGQVLFILVSLDETKVKQEIDAVPQLVKKVKAEYTGHENITILGNFYSDEPYYNESSESPLKSAEYIWIIPNNVSTTVEGNHTYDQIIATANLKGSYAGNAGVFNFSEIYGLNTSQSLEISAHYPIYVEYLTYPKI